MKFQKSIQIALLPLTIVLNGCFVEFAESKKAKSAANQEAKSTLLGSWTSKDRSRFLEITKGGSVVINKKGSSTDKIGFFELDGDEIRIFKNENEPEGRTEVARFEIISDHEIVFGENKEYWNVVNITGRWYREGTDIDKVIAEQKYQKLTPEEQNLVDVQKKKMSCEELIRKLEQDRKNYLVKLSDLDEEKDIDSWRLNASMLAKTKRRLRDADYEMKKLVRAEEALETLIADNKRMEDIKDVGLDEEGLKKLLLSIGEAESKLPIKNDVSDFELKSLVDEELKSLEK